MKRTTRVVEYLLERGEIKLPYAILKTETIKELDKAISSGSPAMVSKFYEKMAEDIDEYLDLTEIEIMIDLLSKKIALESELSEDDFRILEFLVNTAVIKIEDFLSMVGPIYNLLKVAEELKRVKNLSDYLSMFILTSAYVQLYELLLLQIDRRLYYYLKDKKPENKEFRNFLKMDRKGSEHETAGRLNKIISAILGMNETNNSILGERGRIIRNKISHANLFYDAERKVVVASNSEYSVDEFLAEFYKLLKFGIKWIELSSELSLDEKGLADLLKVKIREAFKELSRLFLKVERSPEMKREFSNLVIKWKGEIEG